MMYNANIHEVDSIEFLEVKNFQGFYTRTMIVKSISGEQFELSFYSSDAKQLMVKASNQARTTWKEIENEYAGPDT